MIDPPHQASRQKPGFSFKAGLLERCAMLALTLLTCGHSQAQDAVKPFPQNRVRDFYARQAEAQLARDGAIPPVLPEFPGLDGGAFGHWGQNPESNNTDNYRNTMDYGGLMSMHVDHFGVQTLKAVTVHFDNDASVLFDPERFTFVDSWSGKLLYTTDRFGLGSAAKPSGPRLFDLTASTWQTRTPIDRRYLGFFRHGRNVVFKYRLGACELLDHASISNGLFVRTLQLDGHATDLRLALFGLGKAGAAIERTGSGWRAKIPDGDAVIALSLRCGPGVRLTNEMNALSIDFDGSQQSANIRVAMQRVQRADADTTLARLETMPAANLAGLISGGPARWAAQSVVTRGRLGDGKGPYVIDTLTVPYDKANPFGAPFRIGGVAFFPDGRAAVGTLEGDVWLVDGIDRDLASIKWKRIAAGLYQPLGLLVRDGKILVTGRDQVTELHDLNGDDEIDFYECVTNRFPTGGGGAFVTELHGDRDGALYFFSPLTGVTKLPPGAKEPVVLGSGLRNSNGMGVSPDGRIVLATTQEGDWTPATGIFEVRGGSYHGYGGPKKELGKYGYQMPLCFVPRGVDHSAGGLAFIPPDARWGPLAGNIIGTSFGNCTHYMVLRETIGEHSQGGVVPLAGEFLSGAHRVSLNPRDGQVYIAGTEGWQSYAKENGSLQRVRYVGGEMPLPTKVETCANGLIVRLNCEVDPSSVDTRNLLAEQWNYLYSEAYGSPEYSVAEPGRRGHDRVDVRSVQLLGDRRSVFVEIPQLHPVMQFHLYMQLKTSAGKAFTPDIYYSVFHLGEPFTGFAGYTQIAKRRAPDFPIAAHYPRDPRLVRQEQLGKEFSTLNGVVSVELHAVPGLKFEPRRVRVPPGKRIALTLRNTDVSMPHNFVLVRPDRLQAIGEGAMMLAADPRAVATHYAPNDPGVICLSPILNPLEQYTIYFDSPKEKGAYPFVCTFPGHWRVMQGTLYVADPNEALPPEPEPEQARAFVKMWKTEDIAGEADNLKQRSLDRGAEMFHVTGCIKCHSIAGHGPKLAPDLTDVSKRYRGSKLLQQIIEPSSEINKDYRTHAIITLDGRTITGLIVKDQPDAVHVLANPLKPEEITKIAKSDIDQMEPLPLSTMPTGLLMTLNKDEILDLLYYIESGGGPRQHAHGH